MGVVAMGAMEDGCGVGCVERGHLGGMSLVKLVFRSHFTRTRVSRKMFSINFLCFEHVM